MITNEQRFPIFIVVTLAIFFLILLFVFRKRAKRPPFVAISVVAALIVVGGMVFAKFGTYAGWPWWIYYTGPALLTLVLPPLAFRFNGSELWQYLVLAFLASPAIHVVFSFFFGWHNYMPFLYVPSLHEMLSHSGTKG